MSEDVEDATFSWDLNAIKQVEIVTAALMKLAKSGWAPSTPPLAALGTAQDIRRAGLSASLDPASAAKTL